MAVRHAPEDLERFAPRHLAVRREPDGRIGDMHVDIDDAWSRACSRGWGHVHAPNLDHQRACAEDAGRYFRDAKTLFRIMLRPARDPVVSRRNRRRAWPARQGL